ncbi:hypothetical protein SCA6_016575 [Theobroma cacao]
MNSATDSITPKFFSPFKQPSHLLNLQQAFSNLQTHCSSLFQQTHHHLKGAFDSTFAHFNPPSFSPKGPVFARIVDSSKTQIDLSKKSGVAMSAEAIEERLAGVPVYALSNSEEEFVLVSGVSTKKSLGLLCFKKEDAEALLEQMKSMDPGMRKGGSKVVAVALNKVFQLKVDGVAFRLIPESAQLKNALRERERAGFSDDGFPGVPVFQSRSLLLRSQNKSYRPVFFRKEDLEQSLLRASRQQNQLNPAFRPGDIQVAVFEEIIKGMKDGSTSKWDDVVFIPPGFDGAFDCTFSHFNPPSLSPKGPVFTRIADSSKTKIDLSEKSGVAMSAEAIEESMAGVPVYALNNSEEKFVLVSGVSTKTSLGLFCFKKEDAEALLEQMKSMDPRMRRGSKVVAVALNKVFQMRVDGVALRLIPESAQIKNALRERERAGFSDDGFPGIPVFESRCLILRSQNKSYRPVFFRKEDLEQSLLRASCPQNQLKPAFRPGDIQVAVFEEIIKGMKDGSTSMWDDVVFIPPGFEVPTDPTQQQ